MNYLDALFYILFLPILFGSRLLIRHPVLREWLIVLASAVFLLAWGLISLLVFLTLLAVNFLASLAIAKSSRGTARLLLWLTIAVNLAILGYFNFLADALHDIFGVAIAHQTIGLPLAISFYTFHLISYLVDLSAGRVERAGPRQYLFYLSFFPHLIAGPIVRAWQFFPQIGKHRAVSGDLPVGLHQFVAGVFLKSILADNLAALIDPIWDGGTGFTVSTADRWATLMLYYCQIYADFAGYTLMALGMARLLGYRLPPNFRQPMFAPSLQDFWRRWHITLSLWLRDYLYKPLGGNRAGRARTHGNLLATMLLGGLWHGPNWTFIVWGAAHGVGLVVERVLGLNRLRGWTRAGWFVVVQLWVMLAWVFFRAPNVSRAFGFLRGMTDLSADSLTLHPPLMLGLMFGLAVVLHQAYQIGLVRLIPKRYVPVTLGAASGLFFVADLVINSPSKIFIYFQF